MNGNLQEDRKESVDGKERIVVSVACFTTVWVSKLYAVEW
jgi:hypothetical protein